jgi:CDP-diacylglycerol---glycerol-3-phosphate 3-phosphatidyltransferase
MIMSKPRLNLQKSEVFKSVQKNEAWNIPNALSILRIITVPVLILLLLTPDKEISVMAAVMFAAASMTDWLDGYLARRMSVETIFGKFLDPLADKLLIVTCLIMLISLGRAPAWMVAIITGRELAVTGFRAMASIEGVVIAAGRLGKYKTIFQVAAVTALIAHYEFLGIDFHIAGLVLLWIALVFTIWSGVDYFVRFFKKTSSQA